MRIAVLTLTRDRIAYTRHCFGWLERLAGGDYDHYVLDQGSQDGTLDWLLADPGIDVTALDENIGICRGLNLLLDQAVDLGLYDVIVRFDNDCELLQPDTLATVAELAHRHETILSPRVHGLRNPPPIIDTFALDGQRVDEPHHLGGIFMAIPASLFAEHGFRYDERQPVWGGDELICPWWRARGGRSGYLHGWSINHYETTDGQAARYPDYFRRRELEGGPAR